MVRILSLHARDTGVECMSLIGLRLSLAIGRTIGGLLYLISLPNVHFDDAGASCRIGNPDDALLGDTEAGRRQQTDCRSEPSLM